MKPIKPSSRTTKASHGRLPARKVPSSSSRKQALAGTSHRISSVARPASIRGLSPNTKHSALRSKKHSHSPRPPSYNCPPPSHRSLGSPIGDRIHSSKRHIEYEKRRIESHSPVGRVSSTRCVMHRHISPDFPPSSHARMHSDSPSNSHYSNPPKKKIRREMTHIPPSQSYEKSRMLSDVHVSHKPSSSTTSGYPHNRDRSFSSAVESRPYPLPDHPRDSYELATRHKSINPVYPPVESKRNRTSEYHSDRSKHYNLTLDERFRSVAGDLAHTGHPRVQFTREDLENITIDIKRNLRDYSPTVRRIVDPSEVKLVRRALEGHRPIFDREEIKRAPRDLREDAYNEQKFYGASGDHNRSGTLGLNYKEMENYEITRYKFESNNSAPPHGDSTYKLSDKWGRLERHKPSTSTLDRDERTHGYRTHSRSPLPYNSEGRRVPRTRSMDRDFRPEHRPKPEYPPPPIHKPLPVDPADLRHSLAIRRKDGSIHDARKRLMERRASDREQPSSSELRHYMKPSKYPSGSYRVKERNHSGSHSIRDDGHSSRESPMQFSRPPDRMRVKEDKLSEYSLRSDRLKYPPWDEKAGVPKSFDYYEADDRDRGESFYSRGSSRGFRGRGFRGRFFRNGPIRGIGFRGRGYQSSLSPRGRSYPPKRRLSSSYQPV